MDYSRLQQNFYAIIKEQQIKLGYRKEAVRLYYPLQSLNRFLQVEYSSAEMSKELANLVSQLEEQFGRIKISYEGERFCFYFPAEASEYIHTHSEQSGFLYDFIETVSKHGIAMDEVLAQFEKYSDAVHIEKMDNEEFDYLVYFEDGTPDDFRYCLTDEGGHVIYHRFTVEDYKDFYE